MSAALHGLMAEFDAPEKLVAAARRAREEGYRAMDAYTPYPIEELPEALGLAPSRLPWITFAGGLIGAAGGYLLQYYASVVAYPINVGGRPTHSWPSFIVISFEMAILGAALASILGMLALNGLPMPHHPVFNAPRFALASRSRFFLCVERADPRFDPEGTRRFLESLNPSEVTVVPA